MCEYDDEFYACGGCDICETKFEFPALPNRDRFLKHVRENQSWLDLHLTPEQLTEEVYNTIDKYWKNDASVTLNDLKNVDLILTALGFEWKDFPRM